MDPTMVLVSKSSHRKSTVDVVRTTSRPGLLPLALVASACAGPPIATAEVQTLLDQQAACWNAGDLPGFMATYWRDPALTFAGSRGITRGWEQVLGNYERGYPDAAARGTLRFSLLEVRPLGDGCALVLGRFELVRAAPASGFFTIVIQRRPEGLRIVHDHTS
jgi:ketosteroid isomerase-like protein